MTFRVLGVRAVNPTICVRMGLGRTRLQNRSLLFLRPRRRMFNGYRLVLVFHGGQAESASAGLRGQFACGRLECVGNW
jgi:hypothetical protein